MVGVSSYCVLGYICKVGVMDKFGDDTPIKLKVLETLSWTSFATTGSDFDRSDEACQFRGDVMVW